MDIEIIQNKKEIPKFDTNVIAIKHIEYYPYGNTYDDEEITSELISKILTEITKGINIYLCLDTYGECDFMEVLSDGKWLSLGCLFEQDGEFHNYYTYNSDYADTAEEVNKFNYSDKNIWTELESGGQSPIPKIEAITDMENGVKAVEYFIYTGKLYPGIDWAHQI